jgi:GNAT superfamily N-acetyltransferase
VESAGVAVEDAETARDLYGVAAARWVHQGRSAHYALVPNHDAALVDAPDMATFVVERDGRVVGASVGCALTRSRSHAGLARPDDAGFLGFAAVLPEARGTGAGRAVGEAVIDWSARQGYRSVVTDWRATNLMSSRTWPRLGFRPTCLRLHRLVGH